MQLVWRFRDEREVDYELLWFGVTAAGLVCAGAWLTLGMPCPICLFHALTGLPCLTCGATRAAISCFHLQFLAALRWNPLAVIIYGAIVLFDAYAVAVVVIRSRRLRAHFTPAEKKALRLAVIALLLINWVYLLAHTNMFKS